MQDTSNFADENVQRALRHCLGRFATGITVVTTQAATGEPVGLTVNSFNSVSLNPPLILWSLAKRSNWLETFNAAPHFAVNILAADQEALSQRFASARGPGFADLTWSAGQTGSPILPGCLATLECRTVQQIDGGDHVIYLAAVEHFSTHDGDPLLFFAGRYATLPQPVLSAA